MINLPIDLKTLELNPSGSLSCLPWFLNRAWDLLTFQKRKTKFIYSERFLDFIDNMSMTPMSPAGPPGAPRPSYGPPQPRFQGPPPGAMQIGSRPPYVGSPQGPPGPGPMPMMSGGPPQGGPPGVRPQQQGQMVSLPHRQSPGKCLYILKIKEITNEI